MKTVTFCGHGNLYGEDLERIKGRLKAILETLIYNGAKEFLLGGYGAFDTLCANEIKKQKETYPYIKSVLVIPYINCGFDEWLYDCSEFPPIEKTPRKYAILKRNEYMVEKADVVVSFVKFSWGGAAKTLEYAEKKKKRIIKL